VSGPGQRPLELVARYVDGDRVGVGATKEPGTVFAGEQQSDGSWGYSVSMDAGYVYAGPGSVLERLDDDEAVGS
jgi:hypothetical protein